MVCCKTTGLPFFYTVFPGSIVDVKTVMNFIKYLKIFNLQDLFLIFDRGFFSMSNISELLESDRNLSFIIPLPFSLKLTKELIANNLDIKNTLLSGTYFIPSYYHTNRKLTKINLRMKKRLKHI
jgi:transposase